MCGLLHVNMCSGSASREGCSRSGWLEGFLEEEGIRLDRQKVWKCCFSPLPLCFFPTSLHKAPSGTRCRVWLHVSFLIRRPRDKPGHRDGGSLLPWVCDSLPAPYGRISFFIFKLKNSVPSFAKKTTKILYRT